MKSSPAPSGRFLGPKGGTVPWREFLTEKESRIIARLEERAERLDAERHAVAMQISPIRNRAYQRAKASTARE